MSIRDIDLRYNFEFDSSYIEFCSALNDAQFSGFEKNNISIICHNVITTNFIPSHCKITSCINQQFV